MLKLSLSCGFFATCALLTTMVSLPADETAQNAIQEHPILASASGTPTVTSGSLAAPQTTSTTPAANPIHSTNPMPTELAKENTPDSTFNPDAPGEAVLDESAKNLQKPLVGREKIYLWGKEEFKKKYPDSPMEEGQVRRGGGAFKYVSYPCLYVFKAQVPNPTGAAMIICPGGAYRRVGVQGMGVFQSRWLNEQGITTFVLKYRTIPGSKPGTNGIHNPDALDDVQRAVRLIRSRAKEFGINPEKLGITGESAGANLILNLMMSGGPGDPNASDPIERESSRPDFTMLIGTWPGIQKWDYFKFNKDMPPAFVAHIRDDNVAPVSFASYVYDQMVKADMKAVYYIYEDGGHTAFTFNGKHESIWPDHFLPWLEEQKIVVDQSVALKPESRR